MDLDIHLCFVSVNKAVWPPFVALEKVLITTGTLAVTKVIVSLVGDMLHFAPFFRGRIFLSKLILSCIEQIG